MCPFRPQRCLIGWLARHPLHESWSGGRQYLSKRTWRGRSWQTVCCGLRKALPNIRVLYWCLYGSYQNTSCLRVLHLRASLTHGKLCQWRSCKLYRLMKWRAMFLSSRCRQSKAPPWRPVKQSICGIRTPSRSSSVCQTGMPCIFGTDTGSHYFQCACSVANQRGGHVQRPGWAVKRTLWPVGGLMPHSHSTP